MKRPITTIAAMAALLVATACALIVLSGLSIGAATFRPFKPVDFFVSILPLVVISVFVERTIQVFFGIWIEPENKKVEARVENAHAVASALAEGRTDPSGATQRVLAAQAGNSVAGAAVRETIDGIRAQVQAATSVPRSVSEDPASVAVAGALQDVRDELITTLDDVDHGGRLAGVLPLDTPVPRVAAQKVVAQEVAEAEAEKTAREAANMPVAYLIGGTLGLLVAMSGVRSLGLLVDPVPTTRWWTLTDVLLTAGMIGGGADGFHRITAAVSAILDSTKKKAEAQAAK